MKKTPYLIIMLFFAFFSCEKPNEIEIVETSEEENSNSAHRDIDLPTSAEILENDMEWAAYLTAQAILTNESAKAQFMSALSNSEFVNIVRIEDLLGPNLINLSFRNAFEERFNYFDNLPDCGRCPGGRLDKPEQVNCSGFCSYLKVLLNENCLEIVLPNGFNPNISVVSSTAHPLNLDAFNDAYIHTEDDVTYRIINNINVSTFTNPLVVRPFIDVLNGCKYDAYSELNFTYFLH